MPPPTDKMLKGINRVPHSVLLRNARKALAESKEPIAAAWRLSPDGVARIKVAMSKFKLQQDAIHRHKGDTTLDPPQSAPMQGADWIRHSDRACSLRVSTRQLGAAISARCEPSSSKQHGVCHDLDFLFELDHGALKPRGEAYRVPSWGVDAGDDSHFLVQKAEGKADKLGHRPRRRSPDPTVFQRF